MNNIVKETYRLLLTKKLLVNMVETDKIRIAVISNYKPKPNIVRPSVISRSGTKLKGIHNYLSKIICFSTLDGLCWEITRDNIEMTNFADNLANAVGNLHADCTATEEVLQGEDGDL